jgi:putative ABC thiamine transporter, inner membrane subunit
MSTTMVSVTVIDSDGASDIAAPAGTTVAGLCAMLAIDLTEPSVRLSYADGRPLSGGAVLGRDLAAGSVIALSSRVLSAQQVNEASARQENQWLSPVLALVGFSFLLLAAASALCLLPTLGDAALRELTYAEDGPAWARATSSIPVWARGLCALVCMIGATTPLFRSRRVRSHPIMLLLLPALVGYSMIGLVPLAGIHALSVAPVVGVWSALIVTLAVASLTGAPSALSAIIAWGAATLLVTIHAYPLFALIDIAPLAVMIGVLLFLMSPRLALRVPDNQLIDSASLQTIASRIRQPPASAPSTLTGERIATVLSYTSARNTVLLVAASLFVLVGGIPLAHTVTPAMSMGRGLPGFILVIAAITALLTVPRATRSHAGRILPRLCAASLACAFLFGAWVQSWSGPVGLYPMVPVAILVLVGVAIAAWANLYVSKGYAALVGTILDAVQNFSIFTLPPAAVVASGLFAFAWRAVL